MPLYFFTAKSLKGEPKSGTMEAKDESELAKTLRQEGYVLIKADLEEEEIRRRKFKISLASLRRVSLTEKMMFTKNLQVMISAGISLPRALRTLSLQARSKRFKDTLSDIAEEITRGKTFSDSLGRRPNIFSELFVSMIKIGEEAGTLEEVLKNLTQQMEREYELKSKIKGAMMYPAVIICAMLGIGFLMLIMVVPKLAQTFKDLNIELPPTTKLVISFGTFLAEKWFFCILIVVLLFFIFRTILKRKAGKKMIDSLFLRIPVISPIIKKANSASTARTLSSLFASGVPVVRALEIVSAALGNIYFREAIAQAAEKVRKGSKLSEALKPYQDIYPSIIIQMIEVGEETGETSEVLGKLADFFETEVGDATKNLSAIIEPVLMLIIGAVVGFFAISMVQPMYSMLGAM